MLPIVDKPLIHYLVQEAAASGIEQIIIVTAPDKPLLRQYFDCGGHRTGNAWSTGSGRQDGGQKQLTEEASLTSGVTIHFAVQTEPKGLGHAVWCARSFLDDEPFAVMLGDVLVASQTPCLSQLLDQFTQDPVPLIAITRVPYGEVQKYGIAAGKRIAQQTYAVRRLVEKPAPESAPSDLAIIGRYILPPQILPLLAQQAPGENGEIQLTDALNQLAQQQELRAYQVDGEVYDAGDKVGWLKANIAFALAGDEREALLAYLKEMLTRHAQL